MYNMVDQKWIPNYKVFLVFLLIQFACVTSFISPEVGVTIKETSIQFDLTNVTIKYPEHTLTYGVGATPITNTYTESIISIGSLSAGVLYDVLLVGTDAGKTDVLVNQTLSTKPLAPVNLRVTSAGLYHLTLGWSVLPNTRQDIFAVEYLDLVSGNGSVIILGADMTHSLTGLYPGFRYNLSVAAISDLSNVEWSKMSVVLTDNTVPSPPDVTVVAIDEKTLQVSWSIPQNSIEDGINLGYTRDDITPLVPSFYTCDPDEVKSRYCTVNIGGAVAPGQQVTVRVQSYSGTRRSTTVSVPYNTKPSAVTSVDLLDSTNTSLTLKLSITDVRYTDYFEVTIDVGGTVTTQNITNTTFTLEGLSPAQLYTITVVTMAGLVQSDLTLALFSTLPTEPADIHISASNTTSLQIDWTSTGPYNYTIVLRNFTTGAEISRSVTPGTSIVWHDLLPGQTYEIMIRSEIGDLVSKETTLTWTTEPLPVDQILVSINGSQSLSVSWSRTGLSWDDGYMVTYTDVTSGETSNTTVFTSEGVKSVQLSPLFPGHLYNISVSAYRNYTDAGQVKQKVSAAKTAVSQTRPLSPANLRVISSKATTSSLHFEWTYDQAVTYANIWIVNYNSSSGDGYRQLTVNQSESTIGLEIPNLDSGQMYVITVIAAVDAVMSELPAVAEGYVKPICDTSLSETINTTNDSLSLAYTLNQQYFDKYHFFVRNLNYSLSRNSTATPRYVMIPGLQAGTEYTVLVRVGSGDQLSDARIFNFSTYPNRVLVKVEKNSASINLTLTAPAGLSDSYNVSCIATPSHQPCAPDTVIHELPAKIAIINLEPYQNYEFTFTTTSGQKWVHEVKTIQTEEDAPTAVRNPRATEMAPNTVHLTWDEPSTKNGFIREYKIDIEGHYKNYPPHMGQRNILNARSANFTYLKAGYTYQFNIRAKTSVYGPPGTVNITLKTYRPPYKEFLTNADVIPIPIAQFTNSSSITLNLTNAFSEKRGEIIGYTIIITTTTALGHTKERLLPTWKSSQADLAVKAYQAINVCANLFDINTVCQGVKVHQQQMRTASSILNITQFHVGTELGCNEKNGNEYCNGPLQPDTVYYIALRAFTVSDFSDTPYSVGIKTLAAEGVGSSGPDSAMIGGIVGGMLAVLILAGFITFLVVWRFRMRNKTPYMRPAPREQSIKLNPARFPSRKVKLNHVVPLAEFPEHFATMSADSDYRFAEEFEDLKEVGRDQFLYEAELPQNRAKNRFTNILPYDHSRVKLLPTDDEEGSDYINANYIPGNSSPREYIVTQGPLPSTRDDFWRMVWEQNCQNIVMLTKCVEKGREKCDHYWPVGTDPMFYGDLQIAALVETKFPEWSVTEFKMSLGDQSRKLRHFHYTAWPDFGVPDKPKSLVRFVRAVRSKLQMDETGPIIVHCSAGVGRSGTFIVLDRILLQLAAEVESVDIYGIVYGMRKERSWMVQTEQQYICIHQCLMCVLNGEDEEEPIYYDEAHDNVAFEDDEGINVEIM